MNDSDLTYLSLASGRKLPSIGLGFWKVPGATATGLVTQAIEAGYRHLDCACDYGNEAEVGAGIESAVQGGLCRREELWITSKLWNTYHRPEHVRPALQRSLRDLGLDYLDLYLIHFPIALRFVPFEDRYPPEWVFDPNAAAPHMELDSVSISETWQAMEELVSAGLVREIGVCNFGVSLMRDLLASSRIPPSVLQVESHPYLTQEKLLRFCRQQQIAMTAFSPLGAQSYFALNMAQEEESLLDHPHVREIANAHQKTGAQVLLRWGVQRGTAIIPKTSHPQRLRENIALFDFTLSSEEMNTLSSLNRDRRFNDPGEYCEAAFNTFCPIYE